MGIGNLQPLIKTVQAKKTKTGSSPEKLGLVPPFPTGEQASGSQDQPKHDFPESDHESKGKRCRPTNIQPNPNTQGPPPVKKGNLKKRPDHDTEKDENRTKTHWRKATKGYLVDQLSKRGWKWPKTPDGKMKNFHKNNWPNL